MNLLYSHKKLFMSLLFLACIGAATILTACGLFGKAPASWVNGQLDDLSWGPDTPPYLSLHYRLRYLQFALDPQPEHSIIFLGDSMTDNGNWKDLFPREHVINMGIGGDTTQGILNRLPQVIRLKPKKIFLMVGTNDLCYNRSIPDTLANYDTILALLQESLPDTELYVESVLPFNDRIFPVHYLRTNDNITVLNDGIRQLAAAHGLPYLDITSDFTNNNGRLAADLTVDGLHLNHSGYEIWHNDIYDQVKS